LVFLRLVIGVAIIFMGLMISEHSLAAFGVLVACAVGIVIPTKLHDRIRRFSRGVLALWVYGVCFGIALLVTCIPYRLPISLSQTRQFIRRDGSRKVFYQLGYYAPKTPGVFTTIDRSTPGLVVIRGWASYSPKDCLMMSRPKELSVELKTDEKAIDESSISAPKMAR
jgi:hypothetical protein